MLLAFTQVKLQILMLHRSHTHETLSHESAYARAIAKPLEELRLALSSKQSGCRKRRPTDPLGPAVGQLNSRRGGVGNEAVRRENGRFIAELSIRSVDQRLAKIEDVLGHC